MLDDLADVARFREDAYLDRYAQPDKSFADRSDTWWPAPYWDIDTGFASRLVLLTAVDAGFGACFFGIPVERIDAYRAAFRRNSPRSERSPLATATSRHAT